MHDIIYHTLFGLLNVVVGVGLYLWGKRDGRKHY